MLDIRIPIGLMFSIFGLILFLFGMFSDPKIYETHSMGLNINRDWGQFLIVFGVLMLFFARWGRQK